MWMAVSGQGPDDSHLHSVQNQMRAMFKYCMGDDGQHYIVLTVQDHVDSSN